MSWSDGVHWYCPLKLRVCIGNNLKNILLEFFLTLGSHRDFIVDRDNMDNNKFKAKEVFESVNVEPKGIAGHEAEEAVGHARAREAHRDTADPQRSRRLVAEARSEASARSTTKVRITLCLHGHFLHYEVIHFFKHFFTFSNSFTFSNIFSNSFTFSILITF